MSIPEIKPITYTLAASTKGPLSGKTLTGGRESVRFMDGATVDVAIFPTEENGFDSAKYGREIVVKTTGRPDLAAAVATQRAEKAAAFEAAVPGAAEIIKLAEKVGNDYARYEQRFSKMMEDEGNDGALPPKTPNEALALELKRKLDASPRAALYLKAMRQKASSGWADNSGKGAAGKRAMEILEAGGSIEDATAALSARRGFVD